MGAPSPAGPEVVAAGLYEEDTGFPIAAPGRIGIVGLIMFIRVLIADSGLVYIADAEVCRSSCI